MPKLVLDDIDMSAEREGSAMKKHTVIRASWGKKTAKSRKNRKDADAHIERRTVSGYYTRSV